LIIFKNFMIIFTCLQLISEQLNLLYKIRSNVKKYNGLIHIISNIDFLIACYYFIKDSSEHINTTPDKLYKINFNYFKTLSIDLKKGYI